MAARGGYDRDVGGPWQRTLRQRPAREPYVSLPLRGPSTVEAAMMGRRGDGPGDVSQDFAALVAEQDLRASQLQHELDMLRGRKTDASGRDPVLPTGAVDVGRFLSSIPTFQPELNEMEGYLDGRRPQPEESPVRRVAVEPTVSPAVKRTPEEEQEADDWRAKATALLHAADSASAAASALTSTAEAIAATLPRGSARRAPSAVVFSEPAPAPYDPRQDVPDAAHFTTAAAAMMAGPAEPLPARPGTSHGRGRQPHAMAPPMIADDEYDEDLHKIAQYEKRRGPIASTTAPVPDDLPGLAWHGEDNDDEDAAFTMVSPEDTEEDEEDTTAELDNNTKSVSFEQSGGGDGSGDKPPALSVPVSSDEDENQSEDEQPQEDSEIINEEPGLGQVSPGTPPAAVVQAWRDEEDSLLPPAPGPDTEPVVPTVAKVRASPSRSQGAGFRAVDTEPGHAGVLSSLKTLGVSTQVHAVIESTDNVLEEMNSLREEVSTLKKRLASERRARVEGAAREALLRDRLHAVQGALPPISADVEEMARFYARVAPGYATSDKPAKVVKYFHRKAQKEDRATEWRQYMCEQLAERWGQPAFDLLDCLAKRVGVDEPSVASESYKAVRARSEATERTRTLAQPSTRHNRQCPSKSEQQGDGKAKAKSGAGRKKTAAAAAAAAAAESGGIPPAETRRPVGAAASTKVPTANARSRLRGQRKAADRAAAVGRVGKPAPEGLFFGGFGATNDQVSAEADRVFEYKPPTEALAAVRAAKEAAAASSSSASPLQQAQAHIAEAKAQLAMAGQQSSEEANANAATTAAAAAMESPVRGWDGTPRRPTDKVVNLDSVEAALDQYVESQADAGGHPAGPIHAQYAEFVGGTWRYPGRRMMERLQLELGGAEGGEGGEGGVGSALLGAEAAAPIEASSAGDLPLDAPGQQLGGSTSSGEQAPPATDTQPEPAAEPASSGDLMGALGDLMGALRQDPDMVLNHPGMCTPFLMDFSNHSTTVVVVLARQCSLRLNTWLTHSVILLLLFCFDVAGRGSVAADSCRAVP